MLLHLIVLTALRHGQAEQEAESFIKVINQALNSAGKVTLGDAEIYGYSHWHRDWLTEKITGQKKYEMAC